MILIKIDLIITIQTLMSDKTLQRQPRYYTKLLVSSPVNQMSRQFRFTDIILQDYHRTQEVFVLIGLQKLSLSFLSSYMYNSLSVSQPTFLKSPYAEEVKLPEVHDGFVFVLMIRTRRFSTSFMHDYHFMEFIIKCENLTKKYNFKCDGIIIQSKTNTKCHTFSTVLQSQIQRQHRQFFNTYT